MFISCHLLSLSCELFRFFSCFLFFCKMAVYIVGSFYYSFFDTVSKYGQIYRRKVGKMGGKQNERAIAVCGNISANKNKKGCIM